MNLLTLNELCAAAAEKSGVPVSEWRARYAIEKGAVSVKDRFGGCLVFEESQVANLAEHARKSEFRRRRTITA